MMKIIGAVMIASSSFLMGFLRYISLRERPQELDMFIKLLTSYNSELKWTQKTLFETIKMFDYPKFRDYIEKTAKLFCENDALYSFIDGNEYYSTFHLQSEDKKILWNFFERSGKSGLDIEIDLCEKTVKALEFLKQEAEVKFSKSGPLSLKLSLICGIWFAILLI